jgi:hypothetical protein
MYRNAKGRMNMKSWGWVVGLVLLCGSPAWAAGVNPKWKVVADPATFAEQAKQVREDMKPKGAYGGIDLRDREAVEENLDIIEKLLQKQAAGPLPDADQVRLANAQEKVNAVLTSNEGNRLICTFERRSGTNFKEKICYTARERDTMRRKSQQGFQDGLLRGGGTQQRGN